MTVPDCRSGKTRGAIMRRKRRDKQGTKAGANYQPYEPTLEQIARECAAIRETWTSSQEQSRIVDSRDKTLRVSVQVVSVSPAMAEVVNRLRIERRGV